MKRPKGRYRGPMHRARSVNHTVSIDALQRIKRMLAQYHTPVIGIDLGQESVSVQYYVEGNYNAWPGGVVTFVQVREVGYRRVALYSRAADPFSQRREELWHRADAAYQGRAVTEPEPPQPLTHREAIRNRIRYFNDCVGKPMGTVKHANDAEEFYLAKQNQRLYGQLWLYAGQRASAREQMMGLLNGQPIHATERLSVRDNGISISTVTESN